MMMMMMTIMRVMPFKWMIMSVKMIMSTVSLYVCEIRRTNDYMAPWMTEMITPRLSEDLLQKIEGTAPQTAVSQLMINYTR